jgi:hypothetical protein
VRAERELKVETHNKDRGLVERELIERELRRYILGKLTEQDEQSFERRLIAGNDEYLQEVEEIAEVLHDELVEDYISEKLSGAERTAFEQRLLPSPKIGEKLMLDKALRVVAGRKKTSLAERLGAWLHPILRPVPVAVSISLLLMAVGWSVHRIALMQGRLDEAASRQTSLTVAQESLRSEVVKEGQKSDALARELAAAASRLAGTKQGFTSTGIQGMAAVASFVLKPGSKRGSGQTTRVAIASGQILVELKLDVGIAEYPSYRAALYDSRDNELIVAGRLRSVSTGNSVHVPVQLPVQVLRADDYQIRLSGVTANGRMVMIDSYPFRAVRR